CVRGTCRPLGQRLALDGGSGGPMITSSDAPRPNCTSSIASVPGKTVGRDLTRVFGHGRREVAALGPIDFSIGDGEFVSLVGPSGCGKSTLLRIVAGLIRPSGGMVEIRSRSEHPSTMIFQDYGIYPWKTVLRNVTFGLEMRGIRRA